MINSVSAVSFKAAAPAQSAQDRINAPGKFTQPDAQIPAKQDAAPKKKHVFLKTLAGIAVGVIAIGTALRFGFAKGGLKVLDEAAMKEAKFSEKIGHYLGKAGQWVDTNIWSRFSKAAKEGAEAVEDAASKADDVVEDAAQAGAKAAGEVAEEAVKAGEKAGSEVAEATAKAAEEVAEAAGEAAK